MFGVDGLADETDMRGEHEVYGHERRLLTFLTMQHLILDAPSSNSSIRGKYFCDIE